jgi:hypothetical protein
MWKLMALLEGLAEDSWVEGPFRMRVIAGLKGF